MSQSVQIVYLQRILKMDITLPPFLGFFAGKRFVPIVTSVVAIATGVVLSFA
jgi:phosphotransferase system  glucose/maltose/N-acetylglucosamine-specific IIC component